MSNKEKVKNSELEKISGGHVFNAGGCSRTPSFPYEVINDNTGDVEGRYKTYDQAVEGAKRKGLSEDSITWKEVSELRAEHKKSQKKWW